MVTLEITGEDLLYYFYKNNCELKRIKVSNILAVLYARINMLSYKKRLENLPSKLS